MLATVDFLLAELRSACCEDFVIRQSWELAHQTSQEQTSRIEELWRGAVSDIE